MKDIPVTFELSGKTHNGILSKVMGAGGSSMFHLSVNKFHWGQIWYTDRWRCEGNKEGLPELAEYFGRVIVAAMDGE